MAKSLFPEDMMKQSSGAMSLETIAGKLFHFEAQLQLLHWQTSSIAEHEALGSLYAKVSAFRDDVIEKLMGYMSKRPKAFKIEPIMDGTSSMSVVKQISEFSYKLYEWAGENHYCDVENMAQELSGDANKTLYLLTLS